MFDVLILLAKIKKWFGQFGDLGGLFLGWGFGGPSVFLGFLWVDSLCCVYTFFNLPESSKIICISKGYKI
jgi:hypothetical protein